MARHLFLEKWDFFTKISQKPYFINIYIFIMNYLIVKTYKVQKYLYFNTKMSSVDQIVFDLWS